MTVSLDSFPAVWDNTIITRGLETEFDKPSQPNDSIVVDRDTIDHEVEEEAAKLRPTFAESMRAAWDFGWDEGRLFPSHDREGSTKKAFQEFQFNHPHLKIWSNYGNNN